MDSYGVSPVYPPLRVQVRNLRSLLHTVQLPTSISSHLISFTTMYVISNSASEDERRRLTGAKKTMSMETAILTVTNAQG